MESLRHKEYRWATPYLVISGVIALQRRVRSLVTAEAILQGVLNKGVLNKGVLNKGVSNKGGLNKGGLNKAIGASPLGHSRAYTSRRELR